MTDSRYLGRLLPALDVVVWEYDWERDVFTAVNSAVERILGYPQDEWYEPGFWAAHLHPLDAGWVPEYCRTAFQRGRDFSIRYRMVAADGSTVWVKKLASTDAQRRVGRGVLGRVRWPRIPSADHALYPLTLHEGADEMPLQVLEIDSEGIILWANRTAAEFHGIPVQELVGADVFALIAEDDRETARRLREQDRSPGSDTGEPALLAMVDAGDARHLMEVTRSIVRDDRGEPQRVLLTFHDVTAHEIELLAVRSRADELQVVVDASGDLYVRVDSDGVCTDCRVPRVSPIPLPKDGIVGKALLDLHPVGLRGLVEDSLREAREGCGVVVVDAQMGPANSSRLVEMRLTALDDGGLIAILRNVTSRHEREVRLTRSEAKLRSIVNGLPLGLYVYLLDQHDELRLIVVNEAADEIVGVDHDPFLGKTIGEVFPLLVEDGLDTVYKRIALEGGVFETPRFVYDDGVIAGTYEIHAFQSSAREVTVLFEEITERERQKEREAVYRDRLKALASEIATVEDRERKRLAQELHDRVSQPLAVCRMHLRQAQTSREDALGGRADSEKTLMLLDMAIKETRSLTTELFPPVLHELGLPTAIRWLCEECQVLFGIECAATVEVDDCSSFDDKRQAIVFRAARELIANVKRHSGATLAEVRLSLANARLVLEVQDNGCGFDLEGIGAGADSGFGLFSLRERLEQLGGSLDVEAPSEGGAVVIVCVPAS